MQTDVKVEKSHKLYKIGMDLTSFIKGKCVFSFGELFQLLILQLLIFLLTGYFKHRRTAATHAYAIIISPEDRKRKPYALPVQLIPYVGMGQEKIRKVLNNLIQRMKDMGMAVAGMLSYN